MRRWSSGNTPRSGFLLVEALTAMAIGALLLVALGSLVSLVTRAADRTSGIAQDVEETSRIFATLTNRIEAITPQRWAGTDAGFVFEGSETAMLFARITAPEDGAGGSRLVLLASDKTGTREQDLPLPPDARDLTDAFGSTRPDAGAASTLLQKTFTVRFAYYQRLADGTEALTDRWSERLALPAAIRVTLSDLQGRFRGSVRIPVRVDAEPGCAAPAQGRCSLAPRQSADPARAASSEPIDPDDARGWERYATP
jgi:type II secretory pathway component PulJ